MICPCCGLEVREHSRFCPYCDTVLSAESEWTTEDTAPDEDDVIKVEAAPEKETDSFWTTTTDTPEHTTTSEDSVTTETDEEEKHHGVKWKRAAVWIICVALGVTCAYFYQQMTEWRSHAYWLDRKYSQEISALKTQNSELTQKLEDSGVLETDNAELTQKLEESDTRIAELETSLEQEKRRLEEATDQYNRLTNVLKNSGISYASENYYAKDTDGVLFMKAKDEKKLTLVTVNPASSPSTTYSISRSGSQYAQATWGEFVNNTNTITIKTTQSGITCFKFTNDANTETFRLIVVAED